LTRTDILHFFSGLRLDIITEISKEVEDNTIGRVNSYEKQYVPRRNGDVGGSHGGGGGVGRSKNEHRNSRVSCVPKGAEDAGERGPFLFIFIVEQEY
jgi:hypothetical protein